MRTTLLKVLTVALIAAVAPFAQAYDQNQANLVDSWYVRYLGRHGDANGVAGHAERLSIGTPSDVVEAGILVSPEYYLRIGGNDASLVAALYRDALGINATQQQVQNGLHALNNSGDRERFIIEFLGINRAGAQNVAPIAVQSYRQTYTPLPRYNQGYQIQRGYRGWTSGFRQPYVRYGPNYR